ncbi:JAB N-terminal domain-containing protein [Dactylosporangium siamense]|uniref:JAB-N domain-containing protein n=1 Tax=Dactylosporangium siamense TaxID=685454 RepID=A0A919PWX6_9ACTN|nr:JAB N-terminal domain-containing protein [Dactylosporangium siamense]GIG49998.1 hypothetical protein Dsi01nite_080390 [Dactylosporangium siamense]
MSIAVDVYRSDDYVKVGRVSLHSLLRGVFEDVLGQSLDDARFTLDLHAVEDLRELTGPPAMINLRRSHGFLNVRISRKGVLLYQHPHSIQELVGRPLQRMLTLLQPEETHWGYGIAGPGMERVSLVRPAPRPAGVVEVRTTSGRPRVFHLEAVQEPDPPTATPADLGVTAGGTGDRDLLALTPEVHDGFVRSTPFSSDVEEGGFLVGEVFLDAQRPGRHLIRMIDALPAERTGASMLQFTFTGESFLRINDIIARRGPQFRLIGWYHTHLFPATDAIGLSSIDVELHARMFRRPWQVAALVNLDGSTRTLRVYGWDGTTMHDLPYQVAAR